MFLVGTALLTPSNLPPPRSLLPPCLPPPCLRLPASLPPPRQAISRCASLGGASPATRTAKTIPGVRSNELRASLAAALRPLHNPSPRRRSVSGWTGVAHLPRRRRPARVRQPTVGRARLIAACTTTTTTTTTTTAAAAAAATTASQGETPCAPNTMSTLASTPSTVTLGSPKAAACGECRGPPSTVAQALEGAYSAASSHRVRI
jgi:hypothetical protein